MTDVFISYSRRDKAFVQVLNQALLESKYEAWVDWENIPLTADWWEEIKLGIEAADTFIFVITPDSISSNVCRQEVDHAVDNNKRLVPVVRREGFDMTSVHPELGKANWLFFKEDNDFAAAFQSLVKALDTDLPHVKTHTRLLVRTLEWEKKQRSDDFLLRGSDLEEAENWLKRAIAENHSPLPTEQQKIYITKSREVEDARQRLAAAGEKAKRLVRVGAGVLAGTVAIAAIVGTLSVQAYRNLRGARVATETEQLNIEANRVFDSQQIQALLLAMKSGQQAKQLASQNEELAKNSSWALERILNDIKEKNVLEGHQDYVWDVDYSSDGNYIVSASRDGTAIVWNSRGDIVTRLSNHSGEVYNARFSPDGQLIATASEDKTIKLWDLAGNLQQTLNGHADGVNSISFSPDGKTIASVSADKTVRLWNLTGKQLLTLRNDQDQVTGVQFSPDGKTIAVSYWSGLAKLWDLQGQELLELEGHKTSVSSIQFNADGQIIGTTSLDGTARLWNLEGEEIHVLKGPVGRVRSIDFSSDGTHLATVSDEGVVWLWDTDGNLIDELKGHAGRIDSVAFSPDGTVMATASQDSTIRLWDISGSQALTLKHHTGVCSLTFFRNKDLLASLTQDKTLYLWDLNGNEIAKFPASEPSRCHASELALDQDDGHILSTGTDNMAVLRDSTGKELARFTGHPGPVYAVGFSETTDRVFTISSDEKVRLWNTDGKATDVLSGGNLWKADFSPDGEFFAAASTDGYIKIWSSRGQLRKTFKANDTVITNLQFAPESNHFLTTSFDRSARLWNLDGEQIRAFDGHDAWIFTSDFSADGRYLAIATTDGTVYIWSLEGKLLRSFKAHEATIPGLKFLPDGNMLATASTDGTIKMWTLDESLDKLLARGCEWLDDYLIHDPEALSELDVCQTATRLVEAAPALVLLGEENAKKGDIETAIAQFEQAQSWNTDLTFDPYVLAEKFKLIGEGEALARAGEFETALAKFQEAESLGEISFDPALQAKKLSSMALLNAGELQIVSEDFSGAIASLTKAQKIDPKFVVPAHMWNKLCWQGTIQGHANQVLEACEEAVSLAPKDENVLDSRGLAKALTGDVEGAIADFEFYIQYSSNEEARSQRQQWIEALKAGENPFTPEVLGSLQ